MNLKAYTEPARNEEQTILERYASGDKNESLLELAKRQKDMEWIDILTLRKNKKMCCVRDLHWLIFHNTVRNLERNREALEELRNERLALRQSQTAIGFGSIEAFYCEMFPIFFDYNGKMRTEPYIPQFELDCYWHRFLKDYETSAWDAFYANLI